ncbi:NADH dehydrogenase [ubiquinone] 1 beta subcomplex subunit 5, mitochondrial [Bulinus truncatus]|nr:NADH dehydrogenase [ubiquinone] 1 beta subcomplex subunit 5, mitochondrial [Bulinus truncatus]
MAGMSLLRPYVAQGLRAALLSSKAVRYPLQKHLQSLGQVSVRNGGHERKMVIVPSSFEWTVFKDDLHFFLMLGLLPMAALITYVNIFVGPAQLSDIPEGYEPKEWEYHKSPIKRWFAKYVYQEPQKEYEKTLYWIHYWAEKRYWNKLELKVQRLMEDRLDYKGWYWVNGDKSIVDAQKEYKEERNKYIGN